MSHIIWITPTLVAVIWILLIIIPAPWICLHVQSRPDFLRHVIGDMPGFYLCTVHICTIFIVFSFVHKRRYCGTGHLLRAFQSLDHLDYSLTSIGTLEKQIKRTNKQTDMDKIQMVTMTTGDFTNKHTLTLIHSLSSSLNRHRFARNAWLTNRLIMLPF